MPADDLILNVRQIASYPPLGVVPPTFNLVLQNGLGGPYYSASASALVATALQSAGPLSVGIGAPPADAVAPQIFTDNLVVSLGATHNWNCYFSSADASFAYLTNGPAAAYGYDATAGFLWGAAIAGAAGAACPINDFMQLTPAGELVLLEGSVTLGHDPIGPMQAATAQFVAATTVNSFNGRQGVVTLWITDIVGAGGAPIFAPRFQGWPRADTPPEWSNSTRLATTEFVQRNSVLYIQNLLDNHPFVFSFNGRSGDIVLTEADITAALANSNIPYAPLNSPNFTGYATAPTAPQGSSTGQIATTAFVMNAVADSTTGVVSFNTRTGVVTLEAADISGVGGALLMSPTFTGTPAGPTAAPGNSSTQLATTEFVAQAVGSGFAPLVSPAFLGIPTAPTADVGTNTTQLATTAYVLAAIPSIDAGVLSFMGRTGAVTLLANDISAAGGAVLSSPNFIGNPTAPTAIAGTNTNQLATTAFVMAALPSVPLASTALPLMNGAAAIGNSSTYARGDHVHPSDTSRATVAALANYLPLAGGTLTGSLNGTNLGLSGGATIGTLSVSNGLVSIVKGTATNPVIFFNDGSTNRISFYFNVANGQTTLVDNFSGANITMGPSNVMNLNSSSITAAGALAVATTLAVTGACSFNAGVNIGGVMTAGGNAQVYNGGGITYLTNAAAGANVGVGSDVTAAPASGHNFIVTPGQGFQAGGGAWAALSDARIKTEIGEFAPGLDAILALRPINFVYRGNDALAQGVASMNAGAAAAKTEFVGLIAQEAELAIPEMVTRRAGFINGQPVADLRSLNMTPIWFALINAVKELAARVAALEA